MKKLVFFLVLFTFLIASAWGDTFRWTGSAGTNWDSPGSWYNETLGANATRFPGDGTVNDTVIFNTGNDWNINVTQTLTLYAIFFNAQGSLLLNNNTLNVTNFEMNSIFSFTNATLNVSGATRLNVPNNNIGSFTNTTLSVVNLFIGSQITDISANIITMNGAAISLANYQSMVSVSNVTSSTGTLEVGNKNVEITAAGGSPVTIGEIISAGAVNINSSAGTPVTISDVNAASLTTSIGVTIAGNITTTGNQIYNGAVTLNSNLSLISTAGTITTSAGNVSATNGVTIKAENGITIGSGGITAGTTTTGVIRLESGSGGITIGGPVSGRQLIALADSGTVAFVNSVVNITNPTTNIEDSTNDKSLAPIYVEAYDFTASGSTTITPGSGELCLLLDATIAAAKTGFEYESYVFEQKYHIHGLSSIPDSDKHLVYYNGSPPDFPTSTYRFVLSSSSTDVTFSVNPNRNIYIYNVGNIGSRSLTFTVGDGTNGTGYIQIQGNYTTTGSLTLSPGSTGIKLNGATVNLGTDFNTNGTTLTLENANSSITATPVTLGGTVTGNNQSLTITGNAVFGGAVSGVTTLSVSGTSAINANVTTTGDQTYTGAVTLNADRTFTANPGSLITFGSTVGSNDGTPHAITITNANVRFNGQVGAASGNGRVLTLTVNAGTSAVNANVITTGAQTYTGAVTFNADRTFTASTGSLITFGSTVGSNDGTPHAITITNANVRFNGQVGAASGNGRVLTLTVNAGTAYINTANVYTSQTTTTPTGNHQYYYGPVVLETNVTFTGGSATNSTIRFNVAVNGTGLMVTNAITRIVDSVTTTGNQTYTGAVQLGRSTTYNDVTLTATGSKIWFNGIGSTVRSNNTSPRTLTITAADVQFDGQVGITTPTGTGVISTLTVSGTATIGANIYTTGTGIAQLYNGPVLLSNNIIFTGVAGSTVRFANTVNNSNATARSLTVTTANARFDGVVGGGAGLASVSVGTSAINADITTTGAQSYTGAVTMGGTRKLESTGGTITTTGLVTAPAGVTIEAGGNITIGSGGINASTTGVIRLKSTGANIAINGNINGDQLLAIATGNTVTIDNSVVVVIETSSTGDEGEAASIYINAKTFTANSTVPDSIKPGASGSTGELCLTVEDPWTNTSPNTTVNEGRWHQHKDIVINKDVVYTTGTDLLSYTVSGGTITSPNYEYIESTNPYYDGAMIRVTTGFNIYIIDVGNNAQAVTFIKVGSGLIEIQGDYETSSPSSNLIFAPGTDGIRLFNANITLTGSDFDTDAADLTLRGAGNSITAANVILGGEVRGDGDFTVKASGNIEAEGIYTGASGKIRLESGANITVSGAVEGYQLIAITSGNVTVGSVDISLSNTGEEAENAAIYISANQFNAAGSIIPGGGNGQLCLMLNTTWTNPGSVVADGRWHQHAPSAVKILYSFTEDETGDGRLDRIRVQASVKLNGDFNRFDVEIEEYEIERGKGHRGFELVSNKTGDSHDEDSFYIYLKEKPQIDGGSTPLWSVTRNDDSLKEKLPGNSSIGDPVSDVNIKPFDTIPPRVAYSLSLPGHPQVYVRMSEPVVSLSGADALTSFNGGSYLSGARATETTGGYIFTWQYLPLSGDPADYVLPVGPAALGYLLDTNTSLGIEELSKLKNIFDDATSSLDDGYFKLDDMADQGQRAMDWSDKAIDPAFQPPKYPRNWNYTKYAKVKGNKHLYDGGLTNFEDDDKATDSGGVPINIADVFMPPNRMLTVEMMQKLRNGDEVTPADFAAAGSVIRRITDVLVSIPPSSNDSDRYFAWPVWARYQELANSGSPLVSDDSFGQSDAGAGTIWVFDGTKFLEAKSYDLQARMNSKLDGLNIEMFWSSNVPQDRRNPARTAERGRGSGGLWIPYLGDDPLYYYAPAPTGINRLGAGTSNFPLFNFSIDKDASGFNSGEKFDFIFRVTNGTNKIDFFAARLDVPSGASIPENWYTLVRPFSFDIQNVRTQRGGVSVLNNVINSNNRENAYIRYNLARGGRVTIQVYTLEGTLIKSLRRNEHRDAGEWTDTWDGTNNSGRAVARGMYFVRVVGPDIDEIRKIMVIK
jgi:hypothetical protein